MTILLVSQQSTPATPDRTAALFTLLGVGITALVALASLFIKHFLDISAEKRRQTYEQDVRKQQQEHALKQLALELQNNKIEVLQGQQVQALARFLASTLELYRGVQDSYERWREANDLRIYQKELRALDASSGQVALEELRLCAPAETTELAEKLWDHLRSHQVAKGEETQSRKWHDWRGHYWRLRKELIAQHRSFNAAN